MMKSDAEQYHFLVRENAKLSETKWSDLNKSKVL